MTRWIFVIALACGLGAGDAAMSGQNQTAAQNGQAQSQSGQTQNGQAQSGQTQNGQAGAPQTPTAPTVPPPAARVTDVSSPDAILAATYDVISGPAGQKRDWDRFRSLFLTDARLIAVAKKPGGGIVARTVTPEQYAALADSYFDKNGFYEKEAARHADRYGNIMQIFSTYESRHDAKDAQPFARGINSFQLFFDGVRWWVVTIYWQEESPDNPLPKEFLPPAQ
jgi:hypothetical protein